MKFAVTYIHPSHTSPPPRESKARLQNYTPNASLASLPKHQNKIHCFNWELNNHLTSKCANKHKDPKCFRCGSCGRKSLECGQRTPGRIPSNSGTSTLPKIPVVKRHTPHKNMLKLKQA